MAKLKLPASIDSSPAPQEEDWVDALVDAPHSRFQTDSEGRIRDGDLKLGRLIRGMDLHHPEVSLSLEHEPGAGARLRIQRRLVAWARDLVEQLLAPLRTDEARALSPAGRGVIYQLEQGLGTVHTARAREQLALLTSQDWKTLRVLGVRAGRNVVFVRAMLDRSVIRAALCSAWMQRSVPAPAPGVPAMRVPRGLDQAMVLIGYPVFGGFAIRADLVQRIEGLLARSAQHGPFTPPTELAQWIGCDQREVALVLASFGMRHAGDGTWVAVRKKRRRRPAA